MEKLAYLLWPEADASDPSRDTFRDRLRAALPEALAAAGATRLKLSVTDADVAAGANLHLGPEAPRALVTFWLDCVSDRAVAERTLAGCCARIAGYLVVESEPLRLEPGAWTPGARSPGFSLVGCIEPGAGVSQAAFVERWETTHRQVAIETQSTFSYVRNEVVRPLTPNAPAWGGIVEEGFPNEALSDPRAFYDARGDEARFREHARRMVESCRSFLALDRVDSHPMSEYRYF